VRAVTARLVHAGDAAAQRLTEDLLAGPVSELAVLAQDLRTDPATLAGAAARLRTIAAEVRTLSHGLYPPALADGGLVAALDEHSGVPERRYPAVVEHTVYLLAADDIDAGIAESPGELRVALTRAPRPSDADRVVVLGGSIDGLVVTIPVESGQEAAA